jgi:hypothetical protein
MSVDDRRRRGKLRPSQRDRNETMTPRTPESPLRQFPTHLLAVAATLACASLLAACGGGGDAPDRPVAPMSQSDATADAANASSTGSDTASALDTLVDTTTALAPVLAAMAAAAAAPDGRMQAESARPQTSPAPPSISGTVACPGGGTATLTVTGTLELLRNGQLDAGEAYTVTYAQCSGGAGLARLDGRVDMAVLSADHATSPASVSVGITATHLVLALPAGNATLDGTATLARSVATSDGTTTVTSHVTVPSATLATAFNARNGTFALTDLDATRTVTSVGGSVTGWQYTGHHTLSGTAWGRTFSMNVSTTGSLHDDAGGALVSGAWTVVRPHATVVTTVANGLAVITVDDGNDGTIDHTWTFPAAQLAASAG